MIAALQNAEVNLYFNNVNKFQTTSYGTNTSGRGTIVDTTNPGGDGSASGGGVLTVEGRRDGTANVLTLRARDESAPAVALPDGQGSIVRWQGFDGTDFAQMGAIAVVADGQAVANSDAPSKMIFYTTADGSETLTTALTLDKSQNATFAGEIIGNTIKPNSADLDIKLVSTSQDLRIYDGNNSVAARIKGDGTEAIFAGNVTHNGLTMTDGTDVDQVKEYSMTFQLSANSWTDTGIDGTDLATGTYVVQMYVDDHNAGGGHYDEYYSGTMSWFSGSTNSTNVDEIILHRAGHASNNSDIQLRTQRASGTDTHDLMLQVKSNYAHSAAMNNTNGRTFRFKFRRLI